VPIWLRVLVTTLVLTPIMTYTVLPWVTRMLRPWLAR
jgi:antibiotic biosynthesis monooxygenase (ABM) superfamily enzyme